MIAHWLKNKEWLWVLLRVILNVVWFILNIAGILILGFIIVTKHHWFYPFWLMIVAVYSIAYRMIAMALFDALIGNDSMFLYSDNKTDPGITLTHYVYLKRPREYYMPPELFTPRSGYSEVEENGGEANKSEIYIKKDDE